LGPLVTDARGEVCLWDTPQVRPCRLAPRVPARHGLRGRFHHTCPWLWYSTIWCGGGVGPFFWGTTGVV